MYKGLSQNICAGRDLRDHLHFLHFANKDSPSVKGTKSRDGKLIVFAEHLLSRHSLRSFHPTASLIFFHFNFWMRKLRLEFQELVQGPPANQ